MNYWKILGHLLINVSWHLLVLYGFARYICSGIPDRGFWGELIECYERVQNIKGIFNNFVKKDFFYTALSLFAVTEQGLNVTGHLSSALYLYECKLHRTEPVLQVVLLHALVALKNS